MDRMEHNPLGFRFCPTDFEALTYLFHKIHSKYTQNIRLEVVQEFDVYEYQPFDLPRKGDEEFCYYFTHRSVLSKTKINRNTRDGKGYWRITSTNSKFNMGKKNTLVYYLKSKYERGKGRKTNWIMHEYVLCSGSPTTALCRIYERKESEEEKETHMKMRESDIFYPTKDVAILQSNFSLKRKLKSDPRPSLRKLFDCESYADIHNNSLIPVEEDDLDENFGRYDKRNNANLGEGHNGLDLDCESYADIHNNSLTPLPIEEEDLDENFGRYDKRNNANLVEGHNGLDLDLSLGGLRYDQPNKENVVEENNIIDLGCKRYDQRINGTDIALVNQYERKLELAIETLEKTNSISKVDQILEEIKSLPLMKLSEKRNHR